MGAGWACFLQLLLDGACFCSIFLIIYQSFKGIQWVKMKFSIQLANYINNKYCFGHTIMSLSWLLEESVMARRGICHDSENILSG